LILQRAKYEKRCKICRVHSQKHGNVDTEEVGNAGHAFGNGRELERINSDI
jgi:hypothetical protein